MVQSPPSEPVPIALDTLPARADELRRDVERLVAAHGFWEAEARQRRREAEEQAARERELAARLARAEDAFDRTRAAGAARERRAERLLTRARALHDLEPTHRAIGDDDGLVGNILAAAVELASAEKGVYLRPADPFAVVAAEGFDDAPSGSAALSEVARRVAEAREPIVLNDRSEIAALGADVAAASLRNLAGVPIVTGEDLAGVVVLADRREGEFTDEDTRLLLGIGSQAGVALENRRLRQDAEATFAGTLALLCDVIEAKDPYTHGHCEEVAVLALATARLLGFGPEEQHAVFQAGLLHDVGKIAVSDGILLKPGALLPAEREVIEAHPTVGADLVARVPPLRHLAPIIRHHHERHDGAGYPDRLGGDAIPPLARVLGVADAYQAMRSSRPYRPALDPAAARAELRREAGGQFAPEVVEALLRALEATEVTARARWEIWVTPPAANA